MKTRIADRAAALSMALLLTLGMLGSIDHLAARESVSAVWAAAVAAPRG